jgi:hypothetical protein
MIVMIMKTKIIYISEFTFANQPVCGFCEYNCLKVPEKIKDSYEGGIGYEPFPKQHTKWCVRACPFFTLLSHDRAREIIKEIWKE